MVSPTRRSRVKPKLLAGGNPQIPKGHGGLAAYIEAMPGWKRDVGRCRDALIVRTVPEARKAVRRNSPFYGVEGQGWFQSFHCLTKYVKVASSARRRIPNVRYFHIHEDDDLNEELVLSWIKQASELPIGRRHGE